ncbi:hypothetical protein CHELA40_11218 [Chelatococcus asaccharovorans]|nr:hypothetical protein CHELA40_11218 [Chelatococcus asaccharovorans]CAH1685205.1 hypothetical protein CHELA17_64383 [Chelatococcus asaccharovorans]
MAWLLVSLVVRLRHLHPPDTSLGANVGATRTTSKLLVLVELLNLTFNRELHVRRDSNVKFTPLGRGFGTTTEYTNDFAGYQHT